MSLLAKPRLKYTIVLQFELDKPIPDVVNLIAQRAYTLDGMVHDSLQVLAEGVEGLPELAEVAAAGLPSVVIDPVDDNHILSQDYLQALPQFVKDVNEFVGQLPVGGRRV